MGSVGHVGYVGIYAPLIPFLHVGTTSYKQKHFQLVDFPTREISESRKKNWQRKEKGNKLLNELLRRGKTSGLAGKTIKQEGEENDEEWSGWERGGDGGRGREDVWGGQPVEVEKYLQVKVSYVMTAAEERSIK